MKIQLKNFFRKIMKFSFIIYIIIINCLAVNAFEINVNNDELTGFANTKHKMTIGISSEDDWNKKGYTVRADIIYNKIILSSFENKINSQMFDIHFNLPEVKGKINCNLKIFIIKKGSIIKKFDFKFEIIPEIKKSYLKQIFDLDKLAIYDMNNVFKNFDLSFIKNDKSLIEFKGSILVIKDFDRIEKQVCDSLNNDFQIINFIVFDKTDDFFSLELEKINTNYKSRINKNFDYTSDTFSLWTFDFIEKNAIKIKPEKFIKNYSEIIKSDKIILIYKTENYNKIYVKNNFTVFDEQLFLNAFYFNEFEKLTEIIFKFINVRTADD